MGFELVMGFDSEDGKGERPIIPSAAGYVKPLLTADRALGTTRQLREGEKQNGRAHSHRRRLVHFFTNVPEPA